MNRVARVLAALAAPIVFAAPLGAQLKVGAAGIGLAVQHRVDAGNGVEVSSGTIWGVAISGAFGPRSRWPSRGPRGA